MSKNKGHGKKRDEEARLRRVADYEAKMGGGGTAPPPPARQGASPGPVTPPRPSTVPGAGVGQAPTRPLANGPSAVAPRPAPVTGDDVDFLKLQAEEEGVTNTPPVPARTGGNARSLIDEANGVLIALKDENKAAAARRMAAESAERAAVDARRVAEERVSTYDRLIARVQESTGLLAEPTAGDIEAPLPDLHLRAARAIAAFADAKARHERAEAELRGRLEGVAQQRREAEEDRRRAREEAGTHQKRSSELDAREAELNRRDERITAREAAETTGFLELRRKVLGSLESHAETLRAEVTRLAENLENSRSAEEAAARARTLDRARRWQEEEEQRTAAFATEAERAHQALETALAARREAFDTALAEERQSILEEKRALLRLRRRRETRLELLQEDRQALRARARVLAAREIAELEADLGAERERLAAVAADRDRYFQEVESRRALDHRLGGRDPRALFDELRGLEARRDELEQALRERPGAAAAERLAQLEQERTDWQDEERVLRAKLAEQEQQLVRLRIDATTLAGVRDEREALEARNSLLRQALDTLKAEVDHYKKAAEGVNPLKELARYDEGEYQSPRHVRPQAPPLEELVDDLRNRMAKAIEGRTLYYEARDVRSFLGGLATTPLLLLQGQSGTGKTSLPLAFAKAIGAECVEVPVQAGWRDRQDLLGYYNAFHRHYYASDLLQALYRAGTPSCANRPFFIVLDEINLSRVEQFFADFLSLLELPPDKQLLTLLSDSLPGAERLIDGRQLPLPTNVWFIGTANHDETTTGFAPKTYDRAHVIDLQKKGVRFPIVPAGNRAPLGLEPLKRAFDEARRTRTEEVTQAAAWFNGEFATYLGRKFRLRWGNRLDRDIERYVPVVVEAGGKLGEAVDHLVATKILRRLRRRFDIQVPALEELRTRLDAAWSFEGKPTASIELIEEEMGEKRLEEGS